MSKNGRNCVNSRGLTVPRQQLRTCVAGQQRSGGGEDDAEAFSKTALGSGNVFQVKQVHELTGIIALKEKNWDTAIAEPEQASQQNAYNHYRMCLAYQGKGDASNAAEHCGVAAHFNTPPELNFSFIHAKTAKLAATKS